MNSAKSQGRACSSSSKPVCVSSRESVYSLSTYCILLYVLINQRSSQTLEIKRLQTERSASFPRPRDWGGKAST